MSKTEILEDIAKLACKVSKKFRSERDLANFGRLPMKLAVEAALCAKMGEHLG